MTELFHITERPTWEAARPAREYRTSTRGVSLDEQGFIHCSLRHQLRGVAECIYSDADDLVVLVIDGDRLTAPVRYEIPEPGAEPYPHIYGPLPTGAVTAVLPVARDTAGRLLLPDEPCESPGGPPPKAPGRDATEGSTGTPGSPSHAG
jgi:uncharacterized protein (DUF952 family)